VIVLYTVHVMSAFCLGGVFSRHSV